MRKSALTGMLFALMVGFHLQIAVPQASAQIAGPIRLTASTDDGPPIRLDAKFKPEPDKCPARQPRNLHAAYSGTLEIGRRSDGYLYLVGELTFPQYLEGIAEVPRDWPIEALKAQVVAARTYAISHMNPSTSLAKELRFNLCATDACQVYRGLNVSNGAWGDQWRRAVGETAGQILEHSGRPASTFYFSTSNGRTYSNADAFGGTAISYLKPVDETDDGGSPVRKWSVSMPLSDLAETLKRAGVWGPGPIESVTQKGDEISVSGGGKAASMSIERFRSRLNTQAVCLEPKRYPTPSSTGRPLPQVVPSKWMTLRQSGDSIVIEGEGWGHGVGMVQWGAKGKADRQMSYSDILAFYYGGLRPVGRAEPSTIRVGLAVDIEEITLERTQGVKVEGASLPPGTVKITGGSAIGVSRAQPIASVLTITNPSGPGALLTDQPGRFSFDLSGPANITLVAKDEAGNVTTLGPEPRDRGSQTIDLPPAKLSVGNHQVLIQASDGVDRVESAPMALAVAAPSPSPIVTSTVAASPRAVAQDGRSKGWIVATAAAILAAGLLLGVVLWIRRSR